jgi:hypothetical protein
LLGAGIGLSYGLDDRDPISGRFWEFFYSSQRTEVGFAAHPASYPMGSGVKRPGREADHSPPSSADVNNAWNYTSTPPYIFVVWCLDKYRMCSWRDTYLSPGTTLPLPITVVRNAWNFTYVARTPELYLFNNNNNNNNNNNVKGNFVLVLR